MYRCVASDHLSGAWRAVILAARPRRVSSSAARVRVGADAHVVAEHLRALDLVARAAAEFAVADAARPGEPFSVRGAGAPSPPTSGLPNHPCGPTDLTRGPVLLAADLPAVAYDLPKTMGSSLGWMDDNRVPLCEACLQVSTDAVHGTRQSKEDLWAAVHMVWDDQVHKQGPMQAELSASAF